MVGAEIDFLGGRQINPVRENLGRAQAGEIGCAACGKTNPAWAKFCRQCGGRLTIAGAEQTDPTPIRLQSCARCDSPNSPRARHCRSCGAGLEEALPTEDVATAEVHEPVRSAQAGPEGAPELHESVASVAVPAVGSPIGWTPALGEVALRRAGDEPQARAAASRWLVVTGGVGVGLVALVVGWMALGGNGDGQSPALRPHPPLETNKAAPQAPPAVVQRASVSGAPRVIDTATLEIDGRRLPLDGIVGLSGQDATELRLFIAEQGGQVSCQPQGEIAYACTTPSGYDVAAAALVNGAARTSPSASEEYREFEAGAQRERRGSWR